MNSEREKKDGTPHAGRGTPDRKALRDFGLLIGGVFGAIGVWPALLYGEGPRLWALVLAAVLAGLALAAPPALKPVHAGWLRVGHVLGWVNTRILLGIIYYVVITPMGLAMRALGKDPMRRGFSAEAASYRVPKVPRGPEHLERQF